MQKNKISLFHATFTTGIRLARSAPPGWQKDI